MDPYGLGVNRSRRKFTTPPLLGQHTEEALVGILHYSQELIADLRREEAIE
jgi:crotonobetainyl-CoA:carnitine CoA-transferase CaiB-like acyl-CoA transferase